MRAAVRVGGLRRAAETDEPRAAVQGRATSTTPARHVADAAASFRVNVADARLAKSAVHRGIVNIRQLATLRPARGMAKKARCGRTAPSSACATNGTAGSVPRASDGDRAASAPVAAAATTPQESAVTDPQPRAASDPAWKLMTAATPADVAT